MRGEDHGSLTEGNHKKAIKSQCEEIENAFSNIFLEKIQTRRHNVIDIYIYI